jgi:cytochrome c553
MGARGAPVFLPFREFVMKEPMPSLHWLLGMSVALVGLQLGAVPAHADGDAAAGARKSIYCAYCHGPDGNPLSAEIPRLAGQSANDLVTKMKRRPASQDRHHPMLQAFITGGCLNDRDFDNLAAYYSSCPAKLPTQARTN